MTLKEYGWDDDWAALLREGDGRPGRVLSAHRGACVVATEDGEVSAEPTGGLRREAAAGGTMPAAGDWVVLGPRSAPAGPAPIERILPRRSALSRKVKGRASEVQVLAANVDTVFLVAGLDDDFNPRRIERALVAVWETGARPVIVLTKSDLREATDGTVREVEALAPDVPVHAVSAKGGAGLEALAPYWRQGATVALLGSSGVGKSTLVNRLLGWERQATRDVRGHDSRGRHTTTRRELILLPAGGVLIDTPGLRELQLWEGEGGLDAVFADVTAEAAACRFRDCAHEQEPGCAVRASWDARGVPPERVESYRKLQKELAHVAVQRDVRARQERDRRWKIIHKAARKHTPRG